MQNKHLHFFVLLVNIFFSFFLTIGPNNQLFPKTDFFHRSRSRVPLERIAMFFINSEHFNECSISMSYDSSQQINELIDSVSKSKDLIRPCCALLPQRVEIWMERIWRKSLISFVKENMTYVYVSIQMLGFTTIEKLDMTKTFEFLHAYRGIVN